MGFLDIIWHSLMTNVCACKIYDTDSKSWKHSGQHHIQREASSEHEVSSQGESNLYTVQKTWSVCLKAGQLLLLSPSPSKIHYLELMRSCAFSSYEELYKSTFFWGGGEFTYYSNLCITDTYIYTSSTAKAQPKLGDMTLL